MTWPIVSDISNYDYDEDLDEPAWASEFIAAGISAIIVGSQWPSKATRQIEQAKTAGLRVLGTYAEPDAASAIELAQSISARYVGLACEHGGIETYAQALKARDMVRDAGLIPWLYGNEGDLIQIAGPMLYSELVWLANYGTDDPANPRSPITEVNFGNGVRKLAAHQFSSTIVVAGRNRDHSYLYLEEALSVEDKARLAAIEAALTGLAGDGAAKRLEAWNGPATAPTGNSLLDGYVIEQQKLADHIAGGNIATTTLPSVGKD